METRRLLRGLVLGDSAPGDSGCSGATRDAPRSTAILGEAVAAVPSFRWACSAMTRCKRATSARGTGHTGPRRSALRTRPSVTFPKPQAVHCSTPPEGWAVLEGGGGGDVMLTRAPQHSQTMSSVWQ